ncbi:hypothetical protein FDUTEX481_07761 [Tolypothrix sp. PCC 7601]|nr:hypothetical protein FDUTEX481_07761 [Tolypothrix sp. PCC 7601]
MTKKKKVKAPKYISGLLTFDFPIGADLYLIPNQIMFATHQYILEGTAVPVPLQSVAFFFKIGISYD